MKKFVILEDFGGLPDSTIHTHPFKKGEIVYEYLGPTYGCIDWDVGMPVSRVAGHTPFFEVPYDHLEEIA